MENKLYNLYNLLYAHYGAQGWWPIYGSFDGYHPLDYTFPRDDDELFEVCLGAILTQNTTFRSVHRSLHNLKELHALTPQAIKALDLETFKTAIRPSGYFNQKASYILGFIDFFESFKGNVPSREALLGVKGIGEETADSILLYGYNQAEFVVDAYTKRLLSHLGFIDQAAKYKDVKLLMQKALNECIDNKEELVNVYQEYHALIVEHAKRFYSKKPYGVGCFVSDQMK